MLQTIIETHLTEQQQEKLIELLKPIIFRLTEEEGNKISVNELFDTLCEL